MDLTNRVQILGKAVCISLCANSMGKKNKSPLSSTKS